MLGGGRRWYAADDERQGVALLDAARQRGAGRECVAAFYAPAHIAGRWLLLL